MAQGTPGLTKGDRYSDSRIYVGPIKLSTTESQIQELFDRFGSIEAIDVKRGFCFVQYKEREDAKDACKEMDGRPLPDTEIKLTVTLSKRGDRQKLSKCYNCGRSGHLSKDCSLADAAGGTGPEARARSRSPRR